MSLFDLIFECDFLFVKPRMLCMGIGLNDDNRQHHTFFSFVLNNSISDVVYDSTLLFKHQTTFKNQ